MALLEIRSVCKSVSGEVVLENITLFVEKASITVVYGSNGSGKSTLLRIASGMEKPSQGEVVLDGVSLYSLPLGERVRLASRLIAFSFQEPLFINTLSVLENIVFTLLNTGVENVSQARETALKALELVGLRDKANRSPQKLSGGERKRADLARAFAKALSGNTKILVLDEPTSFLDERSSIMVLEAIKSIVRDRGLGALVSTVDDSRVISMASKKLLLRR